LHILDNKFTEVHKRIISLMQNTISTTLTERQARNTQSKAVNMAKETPQQLAIDRQSINRQGAKR
jgi:hypothetical protein